MKIQLRDERRYQKVQWAKPRRKTKIYLLNKYYTPPHYVSITAKHPSLLVIFLELLSVKLSLVIEAKIPQILVSKLQR